MREPDWRPETAHGGTPMWGWVIIANVLCFILQFTVNGFYANLALVPEALKQGCWIQSYDSKPAESVRVINQPLADLVEDPTPDPLGAGRGAGHGDRGTG